MLSDRPARLEAIDGARGEALLTIPLNAEFRPVTAVASARAGAPVIAVLLQHREEGHVRVYEFDAVTGAELSRVRYNSNYRPISLVPLGKQAGQRLYAVLGINDDPATPQKLAQKLEIRSTDMAYVQDAWLGRFLDVLDAVGFDDGGAARIAVLRHNAGEGWLDIAIVDPAVGEVIRKLAFDGQFVPGDFVQSDDIDMNLSPQFSIAGMGAVDDTVRTQTRDLATGAVLHNVWLSKETPIQDLVYLPAGTWCAHTLARPARARQRVEQSVPRLSRGLVDRDQDGTAGVCVLITVVRSAPRKTGKEYIS